MATSPNPASPMPNQKPVGWPEAIGRFFYNAKAERATFLKFVASAGAALRVASLLPVGLTVADGVGFPPDDFIWFGFGVYAVIRIIVIKKDIKNNPDQYDR